MCDGISNVGALISLDSNSSGVSPETIGQSIALLHHFCGCNPRAISINTIIFLTNKKGYPTLSKSMQFLVLELYKRLGRTIRVMVEGKPLHQNGTLDMNMTTNGNINKNINKNINGNINGNTGYLLYLQYLRHLRMKDEVASVLDTEERRMELDYLDHLQSALQPCHDNLGFETYEVCKSTFLLKCYEYFKYMIHIMLANEKIIGFWIFFFIAL